MSPDCDISLAAIILAAGRSSRMGRPKLLLPWGKTSVLGHLLELWTKLPSNQIAVVCAPGDALIQTELNRLAFPLEPRVLNPEPERGMFSSIQCAARWSGWKTTLTHWAIVLGDQPHLLPGTLTSLMTATAQNPGKICQPVHNGQPRHPVLLPRSAFERLQRSEDETLKQFLHPMADNVTLIELNDPGLDLDIDHPEDYEKALQFSFGK
ncbi:MAG: uncharacterized protein JWR69_177 [Pedosphaera sp.]|nr:uncharacterized protein [Pedosphaera sp.]